MAHHAYLYIGSKEEGVTQARGFAAHALNLSGDTNPDILHRSYGLLSVDDARALRDLANLASAQGGAKLLIITTDRIFHEAQNALLKLFEEPPRDTYLCLIVSSEGILLPTLRSRLVPLSHEGEGKQEVPELIQNFLSGSAAAREKIVAKILDRAKSDKDEEKQGARAEALMLAEGVTRAAHETWMGLDVSTPAQQKKAHEYELLLRDLDRFIPILNERSAPLKQIFEHILLVLPSSL